MTVVTLLSSRSDPQTQLLGHNTQKGPMYCLGEDKHCPQRELDWDPVATRQSLQHFVSVSEKRLGKCYFVSVSEQRLGKCCFVSDSEKMGKCFGACQKVAQMSKHAEMLAGLWRLDEKVLQK